MKILVSAANFCREPLPVYPLGMGVIAAVLSAAGHDVRQFDPLPCGENDYPARAAELCRDFTPDLVCVSIRNLDVADSQSANQALFQAVCAVIATWRRLCAAPIILGGSGFTMNPEAVMKHSGADYGIAGEGESAILELVAAIAASRPPVRGTIIRKPAAALSGARYSRQIAAYYDDQTHIMPLQTKRGCPFHCVYCTYPSLEGRTLRLRPLDEVLDDISYLKMTYPDAMLYFTDSVFNDPSHHYQDILRGMLERDLTMPWTGFITPFGVNGDDLDLMAASGLICADLGMDGTTDATLAGLGKHFTFQEARTCCEQLLARKVSVHANAMFGGPGETWDTVREGIANLLALAPVYTIIFSGIRLLSGAPIIATARREGLIADDWDDTQPLYYYAPGIDADTLHQQLLAAFKDSPYCVYPPSSRSNDYRTLHKYGFAKLKKLELSQQRRRS
ncbi:MAG: radical SAM protein [Lentisphaerae bacterium]|jgi:radical SAM superfamily enzyme YgiQ (UPF0313 family)|nr:radical SAM protein [Lentisphaerota bacterium]